MARKRVPVRLVFWREKGRFWVKTDGLLFHASGRSVTGAIKDLLEGVEVQLDLVKRRRSKMHRNTAKICRNVIDQLSPARIRNIATSVRDGL